MYEGIEEARIQHLQMIQGVIARLGNNGFLMKGWAVTLAAGAFGFSVSANRWSLALVAILSSLAFWALDAYFLRCERLFRELHRRVADRDPKTAAFFMGATSHDFVESLEDSYCDYWSCFLSAPLAYFYFPLVGVAIVVGLVIAITVSPA